MINKVFFDITNRCNAQCKYCFTNSTTNNSLESLELPDNRIYTLIDELNGLGIKELSIGGGEPFLRDIPKIVKYAKNKINLSVTTNGTILTDEIIDCLKQSDIKITISLDSINSEISKSVRTGIDVDKVVNNIKRLIQIKEIYPKLSIRTTVSKYNINCLNEFLDFCTKNNIVKWKINAVNEFGRAKNSDLVPDFSQFMIKLDEIIDKMKDSKTQVILPIEKYLGKENRNCTLGNNSIYIDSFGNVYPCAFSEGNLCWGNIKNRNLAEVILDNFTHKDVICKNCIINRYKDQEEKTVH